MTTLTWETPAPPKYGRPTGSSKHWQDIADELKQNPGKWALIAEDVSSAMVTYINHGRYRAMREGFEATGRGADSKGRLAKVYARYVGPNREYAE